MSEADNLAVLERYVREVFNAGDLSVVDDIFSPGYRAHSANSVVLAAGPEGVRQFVASTRAGFPDLTATVEDAFADGDLVASRWTLRGTNTGSWLGYPPTGQAAVWENVVISRFAEGKVAEEWFNFDQLLLLMQLGMFPGP